MKDSFLNGWLEGLIEPNQGFKNAIYDSLMKLLNLLPINESNKIAVFISKLIESSEAKGYFKSKIRLQNNLNEWQEEKKKEKKKEIEEYEKLDDGKNKLSQKDKEGIIQTYIHSLRIPDEINKELLQLSEEDIGEQLQFKKYELNGNLIKTYKVPDLKELESLEEKEIESFEKLISKIEKIDSWNFKGTDIKNLSRYINFNFD